MELDKAITRAALAIIMIAVLLSAAVFSGCSFTGNLKADGEVSHGKEESPTENSGSLPFKEPN